MLRVLVLWRPEDCHDDLSDYDALTHFIHEDMKNSFEADHERLIMQGDEELVSFIPDYPQEYGFVDLNGQTWLQHIIVGQFEQDMYIPLSPQHYLHVSFRFTRTDYPLDTVD